MDCAVAMADAPFLGEAIGDQTGRQVSDAMPEPLHFTPDAPQGYVREGQSFATDFRDPMAGRISLVSRWSWAGHEMIVRAWLSSTDRTKTDYTLRT